MDWIDRLSIWAIVILIISSFALISGHVGGAGPEHQSGGPRTAHEEAVKSGAEVEGTLKTAVNLIEAGNFDKAEPLLNDLIKRLPYEAGPHMAMGDLLMRNQDPVGAMLHYKEATDLNPDYLDKKTLLFQGRKLKNAVKEAMSELDRKIREHPGDESLKAERKTIYYLQRKIAGSCS